MVTPHLCEIKDSICEQPHGAGEHHHPDHRQLSRADGELSAQRRVTLARELNRLSTDVRQLFLLRHVGSETRPKLALRRGLLLLLVNF